MTVGAMWRESGSNDPFGNEYNLDIETLTCGHLASKELASELTASSCQSIRKGAQERIRWLSRKLYKLNLNSEAIKKINMERSLLLMGQYTDDQMANVVELSPKKQTLKAAQKRITWLENKIEKYN